VRDSSNKVRVGVDIGGTFTDIALECGEQLFSRKLLTDYQAPERAIVQGLTQTAQAAGLNLSDIDIIIHGTTLATNALIERVGAHTAFITTEGFRDVLEMRTESRFEQYDLNIQLPPALIERCDRFTLKERMGADGQALIEPSDSDIDALVQTVIQGGFESVAIGFIHAYTNGAHEQRMREALLAKKPSLWVSISSEVSAQIREFERFNTVCANAYVQPRMASYLNRLTGAIREAGAQCPVFMMHSGGGIVSIENAAKFPVRLVESGPAGGAIFAANIAARYQLDAVLSFDMGGTTAKICLIDNHMPKTTNSFEVARTYRFKKGSGMPISIPVVEMVEIGAGGGSIASIDAMKQIRVGPHSAGSEPGPACYQRGGKRPTVTDADLLLGRLDPFDFAGGTIELSVDRAAESLQTDLATALNVSVEDSAFGVVEMVDESMSNAARVHTVESGKDISTYTMITFGGAGPLHAARICEKTGIDRFIVPPGAGVGSAIGFLRAPFSYESVRSLNQRLSQFDANKVRELIQALSLEAMQIVDQGAQNRASQTEIKVLMRYVGQGWEVPVIITQSSLDGDCAASLRAAFESTYAHFFGRTIEAMDIETISWSVKVSTPAALSEPAAVLAGDEGTFTQSPLRPIFDARLGQNVMAKVIQRQHLAPGQKLNGPVLVVEAETSTLVTSAFSVMAQPDGCLWVQKLPSAVSDNE